MNTNRRQPVSRSRRVFSAVVTGVIGSLIAWLVVEPLPGSARQILSGFIGAFVSSEVWGGVLVTLRDFAIGFGIAVLLATTLGLLIGRSPDIRRIAWPLIAILRPIPSAAILPFAMYYFSYGGLGMALFVVTYGATWPMLMRVYEAAKSVPQSWLETGRTLGKGRWTSFCSVVLPACLPGIMEGARIGLGIGLLLTVTTEILAPGDGGGIGYLILDYERRFQHVSMLAAVAALGLVGWLLDYLFARLMKLTVPWHTSESQ